MSESTGSIFEGIQKSTGHTNPGFDERTAAFRQNEFAQPAQQVSTEELTTTESGVIVRRTTTSTSTNTVEYEVSGANDATETARMIASLAETRQDNLQAQDTTELNPAIQPHEPSHPLEGEKVDMVEQQRKSRARRIASYIGKRGAATVAVVSFGTYSFMQSEHNDTSMAHELRNPSFNSQEYIDSSVSNYNTAKVAIKGASSLAEFVTE